VDDATRERHMGTRSATRSDANTDHDQEKGCTLHAVDIYATRHLKSHNCSGVIPEHWRSRPRRHLSTYRVRASPS
jgi:hypothetical protein